MKNKIILPLFLLLGICSCTPHNFHAVDTPELTDYQKYVVASNASTAVETPSYSLKINYVNSDGSKAGDQYKDTLLANQSFYVESPIFDTSKIPNVPYVEGYVHEQRIDSVIYDKVSKWDGVTKTMWTKGTGTSSSPYIIETAAQLAYLAYKETTNRTAGSADPYAGKYFKLNANIDLQNHEWIPIGTSYSTDHTKPFQGIFDGNNHIVTGLKINQPNKTAVGLFGALGTSGVIKNLNVCGNVTGLSRTGMLLSSVNSTSAQVINCKTFGTVTSAGTSSTNCYTGAIAAINVGTVDSCTNYATINSSYGTVGGVLGVNQGALVDSDNYGACKIDASIEATFVGGLVGVCSENATEITGCNNYASQIYYGLTSGGIIGYSSAAEVVISMCSNYGMIESYSSRIGGIVGYFAGGGTIEECANYGYFKGTSTDCGGLVGRANGVIIRSSTNYYKIANTGKYTAGIVGYAYGTNMLIDSCINYGTVDANTYCGGIVGYITQKVINCTNYGTVEGTSYVSGIAAHVLRGCIEDSTNNGRIIGTSRVGGVGGYAWFDAKEGYTSHIQNCTNTGEISGDSMIGGVVGHSLSFYVYSCSNSGKVTGTGTYVGGVVGHLTNNGVCNDSHNTGEITGNASVGGVIGYSGANTTHTGNTTDSIVNGKHTTTRVIGTEK